MTIDLTPSLLQAMSVRAVTSFMSKEASLTEAVAYEAKASELNPEQTRRLIEASNSIAYLRQLQDNTDRTFEFPVCRYEDVLNHMITPGVHVPRDAIVPEVISPLSKVATWSSCLTEHEKLAMISKEVISQKSYLTKLSYDKEECFYKINSAVKGLASEKNLMSKVAYVTKDSPDDLARLRGLLGLTKSASEKVLFRDADLVRVEKLYGLLKQAEALVTEYNSVSASVGRATNALEKTAVFGFVGGLIGKGIKGVSNLAVNTAKNMSATSKGLDHMVGKVGIPNREAAISQYTSDAGMYGKDAAEAKHGFKLTTAGKLGVGGIVSATAGLSLAKKEDSVWTKLHPDTGN
jgi:hypothetical protein